MIQIGRHIEILLLDNDCVIVPDFGGFVAHHVSARYDEHAHCWLPPMRTLGFNPQLRINDSLLVQSYVNAYDTSYPEALRMIEDEVATLKRQLEAEGSYTFDDIGSLHVNAEGNYQFEPCEAGILSPAYYGLWSTSFMTLKDIRESRQEQQPNVTGTARHATPSEASPALLDFTEADAHEETRAIQIKMSWIRNAVAVAAAVIAFFIMATPIANSDLRTLTMSQLQSSLLQKLMPQDTNMAAATPIAEQTEAVPVAEHAEAVPVSKQATAPKAAKPAQAPHGEQPYCIVLASQVKQSNAESYVEQLKQRGYPDAQVYIHNNIVRVVYGGYATEAEAYQQLNKMNTQEEFYEAWVYKKKS